MSEAERALLLALAEHVRLDAPHTRAAVFDAQRAVEAERQDLHPFARYAPPPAEEKGP